MELKDRVAIITGAGRGIGREIAVKLANEGADIAIFELDKNSSIEAAKEISDLGRKALPVVVDVSNTKDVQEAVEKVYNFFGRLDILVNNAGITRDKLILRMQEIDWDLVLNVNLKSVFNCTKAAIRFMTKARWGRIVNISSIVGEMGNPGQVSYAASKAGIIGFTKTVAKEVAKRGITVKEYLAMDAEMSIARFLLPLILKSLGEKTCSICEIMGITPIMARILSVALNWKASPVIIKPCVSIKAAL